jgi:hypothetical protein
MHHCKISDEVRRAVFSGVRVNEAISHLRRLADIGQIDPDEWAGMKQLLDQLSIINDRRNAILHHGAGDGVAANAFTALRPERITACQITVPILRQMNDDLGLIYFLFCCQPDSEDPSRLNSLAGLPVVSWQYRPPSPQQNRRHQDGKSGKQQRRPRPSQG